MLRVATLLAPLACGACALPQAAPIAANVESTTDALDADYYIVPLVPPIVQVMGNRRENGFPSSFNLAHYTPSIALRPGDIVSVTIYEVGANQTFGANQTPRDSIAQAAPAVSHRSPNFAGGLDAVSRSDLSKPVPQTPFALSFKALASTPFGALGGVGRPILVASNGDVPFRLAQNPPSAGSSSSPTTSAPQPTPSIPSIAPPSSRTLPPLVVESDGDILIPFGGSVRVGGLTPTQAAGAIKAAIADKAANPQVLVTFVSNVNNTATVTGEANRAGPVLLSLRGERLLDVIGQAGGSKWPGPDTDIDVVRSGTIARVKLQTVVDAPSENILIRPNDQVYLAHNPRSFTVLGASQKVSQYTFDVPSVSLAEAVARAGGAVDTIGNPAAIYLFREETLPIAEEVLSIVEAIKPSDPSTPRRPLDPRRVKLAYKINMNSGEGYFLARHISILDKDVILIANAEGTQLVKLFTLVRGVTGAASDLNLFNNSSTAVR